MLSPNLQLLLFHAGSEEFISCCAMGWKTKMVGLILLSSVKWNTYQKCRNPSKHTSLRGELCMRKDHFNQSQLLCSKCNLSAIYRRRSEILWFPWHGPIALIGAEVLNGGTLMLAAAIKSRRSHMFVQHQHHISVDLFVWFHGLLLQLCSPSWVNPGFIVTLTTSHFKGSSGLLLFYHLL